MRPSRLEGLAAWADVAASISRTGLSMQSGTLAVERHWSFLTSVFPKAQNQLTVLNFKRPGQFRNGTLLFCRRAKVNLVSDMAKPDMKCD